MAAEENLINFDIIETQKENIQSLPQGRSAKALASAFGPSPFSPLPTPGSTRNLNDAIRAEYETEIVNISDSDDPLDVYDRYVKWTLNAYPSAQATTESQLRPLLERATKAFQSAAHYKNDPRYLRLWMHYIRLFSDAPREAFAYLARHSIGEGLALFYEEFAAWLESASRWSQAEEVYKMGIEREARPTERLLRKFGEFQQRFEQRPQNDDGPSSPALPSVRPALAAKVDPFAASTPTPRDPQAQRLPAAATASRGGRQKLAIFSDADTPDNVPRPGSGDGAGGWDNIGSIENRKKENVVGARPWAGETMKAGKKAGSAPKMMVFKDESILQVAQLSTSAMAGHQQMANARTGKIERVFVKLESVYPNHNDLSEEYSFEELRARHRGWLDKKWISKKTARPPHLSRQSQDSTSTLAIDSQDTTTDMTGIDHTLSDLTIGERERVREQKSGRARRKRVMEVKGETQTIKTNLESPTGRKIRRKNNAEPTMTLHTKAATDDILDIFNQPLRNLERVGADADSVCESDYDEDDYTSGGESTGTGTGCISAPASEFGEEDTGVRSVTDETGVQSVIDETGVRDVTEAQSVSPWSEFTRSKHVPALDGDDTRNEDQTGEQTEGQTEDRTDSQTRDPSGNVNAEASIAKDDDDWELVPPASPDKSEVHTKFIPIPPEDYEAPTLPYRDAAQISQNRLPFMTPIVEKTEFSMGLPSVGRENDYFNSKTPSRRRDPEDPALPEICNLLLSSPLKEITNEATVSREQKPAVKDLAVVKAEVRSIPAQGPIIKDKQCNPVDESIRKTILASIQPPLSSFEGFHDHGSLKCNKAAEIRKFVKALSKASKPTADKTSTTIFAPPALTFPTNPSTSYTIKRELGKGAFAPVLLASSASFTSSTSSASSSLLAIKAEEPPTPWEFYIMRTAHLRLGSHRATASLASPYAMHLFADEGYLLESFHDQGTLLDLANIARADGGPGVLDEPVAMFFAAELLGAIEALHAHGILHGDLKPDNCLVRLPTVADLEWSGAYAPDGENGWDRKGLTLIDFGRGIDLRAFEKGVQFIADWQTGKQDCVEMRELRPWTFQIDYWGAAGVIHVLLFGKWIEDVVENKGAGADEGGEVPGNRLKRYRLKEGLKRYWQTELWANVFDVLMNPGTWIEGEEGGCMPLSRRMGEVRGGLEGWLVENAEKRGLKGSLRRLEERLRERKK